MVVAIRPALGISLGIKLMGFPILAPFFVKRFPTVLGNYTTLFQRKQSRSQRKIRHLHGMFFAASCTRHPYGADALGLPNLNTLRRHRRTELGKVIPRPIFRPEIFQFRQHLGKPSSLGISGGHIKTLSGKGKGRSHVNFCFHLGWLGVNSNLTSTRLLPRNIFSSRAWRFNH